MKSCYIDSVESNVSLTGTDYFYEKIILVHDPVPPTFDGFRISVLFVAFVVLIYPLLYYCRSKYCLVCGKKLVFFINRCYICRFVGAEATHPAIIQALEDKGAHLQGEYPEKCPGMRSLLKNCTQFFQCISCMCKYCFCCCLCKYKKVVVVGNHTEVEEEEAEKKEDMEAWLEDIYNFDGDISSPKKVKTFSIHAKHKDKGSKESIAATTAAAPAPAPAPEVAGTTTAIATATAATTTILSLFAKKDENNKKISSTAAAPSAPSAPLDSSLVDRERLLESNINAYVIYKAIDHPKLPPQPVGYGRQNKNWKKQEKKENN